MVLTKAMGILPASFRVRMSILVAVLLGCFAVPAMASAACTLPAASNAELSGGTTTTFDGDLPSPYRGKFIQLPFDVPTGTTGMRISYCYDKDGPDNLTGTPATNADNTTSTSVSTNRMRPARRTGQWPSAAVGAVAPWT